MLPFPPDSKPPLSDIRVLDASRVLAGPFCGQLLADLGADVIKLERPGTGDDTRGWGPPFHGPLSAYFLSCNRNKRSLTLDIQNSTGHELFHRLLEQCDVLIENFRTDSAEKLGLAPETILAKHQRLVVCSISGFGRTGPRKDEPGYDFAIQALSGLMSITGPTDGPPYKVGVAVADILTGLYAATAILAALHARRTSGHGYAIDLALADCALAAQANMAQAYLTSGEVPPRQGNAHLQIVPYELFETADGWIVLNVGNDSQWQSFCTAAGSVELGVDPRFATNRQRVEHRGELVPCVAAIVKRQPTSEWVWRLQAAGVPHAVVRDYAAVFADPQTSARNMKLTIQDPLGNPVNLVGNPIQMIGVVQNQLHSPPALGADTDSVLVELLGIDDESTRKLRSRNVI